MKGGIGDGQLLDQGICQWELADADLRNRPVYNGSLLIATFRVAYTVNLILICKPKEIAPRNLVEFGGVKYSPRQSAYAKKQFTELLLAVFKPSYR